MIDIIKLLESSGVSRLDKMSLYNLYRLQEVKPDLNTLDLALFFERPERNVKQRLVHMRASKLLSYDLLNGNWGNFKIRKEKIKDILIKKSHKNEKITDYKVRQYVMQIKITRRLMTNSSLRATDILKAIDLQQKALRYIENVRAYDIIKEIDIELLEREIVKDE